MFTDQIAEELLTLIPKLSQNISDQKSKNEVILALKTILNQGLPNKGYKEYTAILFQGFDGGGQPLNPVATVLVNDFGEDIVWTRIGAGSYLGTLAGAFPTGKTIIQGPQDPGADDPGGIISYQSGSDTPNTVYVLSSLNNLIANAVTPTDGILYGAGYSSITIKVYN